MRQEQIEGTTMKLVGEKITPRYQQLMNQFPLYPIRTKHQADAATKILDELFIKDKYDDPGEEAYVIILADLLADYEEAQEANEPEASGLDVLKLLMEAQDMTQTQLARILGISQGTVSQILSGNRQITAEHARRLGKQFQINPGIFL
jgi:antitoxin component HigA of HigAB toxin-antitoxin module